REASTRAGLIVGTTLEITTPVTIPSSKPRSSNNWRSSTASSSAVHSWREVRRQSAARRSPSNRASVTLVLPTSIASSMAARTLDEFPGYIWHSLRQHALPPRARVVDEREQG